MSEPISTPADTSIALKVLRDDNIEKLSKRVAQYVNRPRESSAEDARQDAAIILIGMRARFVPERAAHLSEDRVERLVISWARLRLIDQYKPAFDKQVRTSNFTPPPSHREDRSSNGRYADNVVDPKSIRRLSDLDNGEISDLINRLSEKQRTVARGLLFDGLTQVELAKQLGVSQTAICQTFNRAQDAMTELLHDFKYEKE